MIPILTELTSLAHPGSQITKEALLEASKGKSPEELRKPSHTLYTQGKECPPPQVLRVVENHFEINSLGQILSPKNCWMKQEPRTVSSLQCPLARGVLQDHIPQIWKCPSCLPLLLLSTPFPHVPESTGLNQGETQNQGREPHKILARSFPPIPDQVTA